AGGGRGGFGRGGEAVDELGPGDEVVVVEAPGSVPALAGAEPSAAAEQGERLPGLELVAVVAVADRPGGALCGGQHVELAEHLLEGLPAALGEQPLLPGDPRPVPER